MTRTRLVLLAGSLVAGATFAVTAPAATACAGELCDSICYATTHNPTPYPLAVFDHPCWIA